MYKHIGSSETREEDDYKQGDQDHGRMTASHI